MERNRDKSLKFKSSSKLNQQDLMNMEVFVEIKWGDRRGSNPRQQESQSWALPTELRPPYCEKDAFNWRARQDSNLQPSP